MTLKSRPTAGSLFQPCTCVFRCSVMSDSATPWTVARQASLSTGVPRQECWSGWPFSSPGDLPDPGIKPRCPALQGASLPPEPPGKTSIRSPFLLSGIPTGKPDNEFPSECTVPYPNRVLENLRITSWNHGMEEMGRNVSRSKRSWGRRSCERLKPDPEPRQCLPAMWPGLCLDLSGPPFPHL